ncbi:MAG: hypothetical protein Q4B61_13540 [Bacteroidales bacterium]|nr:hypothetical protein [Bacteroidales bacterium]
MEEKDRSCTMIEDINVALELAEKDRVFIILDSRQSFMREGHGFPLVGNGIYLFNNYDDAKDCIDRNNIDRWESAYPIGSLEKSDKFTNIKNTLMIANALGIANVFLDETYYFNTEWFLNAVGIKNRMEFNMRLTEEESNNVDSMMKESKIPLRFNPINLYEYTNPFEISDERKNELSQAIINPDGDTKTEVLKSISKNTLHENCFSQMLIRSQFIPMAIKKGDMNALSYFNMIQTVYAEAIVSQISTNTSLFVLCDKQSHEVFIRKYPMGDDQKFFYVSYTDLFKHQGPLEYKKIAELEEVRNLIKQTNVDGIVITDGPSANALVDKEAFGL